MMVVLKRVLALTCVVLICVGALPVPALAVADVLIATNGQVIDTLDGVAAVYRQASIDADARDDTYSCAAYVKKYYQARYGKTPYNLIYPATPTIAGDSFVQVSDPRKGDIVAMLNHWGIVKYVSGNNIILIEQNQKRSSGGKYYAKFERDVAKSSVRVFRLKSENDKPNGGSGSGSSGTSSGGTSSGGQENASNATFKNDRQAAVTKGYGGYANAAAIGLDNDTITHIRVGANMKVVAYDNVNYDGESWVFEAGEHTMNNSQRMRISSLVVINKNDGNATKPGYTPPSSTTTPPSSTTTVLPPQTYIELPKQNAQVSGTYTISGWAIGDPGGHTLKLYIDGAYQGIITNRIARADIAKGFPQYTKNPTPGFRYTWDTKKWAAGKHTIKVDVTNSKNNATASHTATVDLQTNYGYTKAQMTVINLIFDAELYAAKYSDLKKAYGTNRSELLKHLLTHGLSEKRRYFSYVFDPEYYLAKNPDLSKAFGARNYEAALIHFGDHGINERRISSPVYDSGAYRSYNSDLSKMTGYQLAQHFINHGMKEARKASAEFDVKIYQNRYADLKKAYGTNWRAYFVHYVQYGKGEGRKAQ